MYNRACDVDGCNVWKCAEPVRNGRMWRNVCYVGLQFQLPDKVDDVLVERTSCVERSVTPRNLSESLSHWRSSILRPTAIKTTQPRLLPKIRPTATVLSGFNSTTTKLPTRTSQWIIHGRHQSILVTLKSTSLDDVTDRRHVKWVQTVAGRRWSPVEQHRW